jgi:hypothetical protein
MSCSKQAAVGQFPTINGPGRGAGASLHHREAAARRSSCATSDNPLADALSGTSPPRPSCSSTATRTHHTSCRIGSQAPVIVGRTPGPPAELSAAAQANAYADAALRPVTLGTADSGPAPGGRHCKQRLGKGPDRPPGPAARRNTRRRGHHTPGDVPEILENAAPHAPW